MSLLLKAHGLTAWASPAFFLEIHNLRLHTYSSEPALTRYSGDSCAYSGLRGADLMWPKARQIGTAGRYFCFLSPPVSSEGPRLGCQERVALPSYLSHLPSARLCVSSFNFLPKPYASDSLLHFQSKASRSWKRSLWVDHRGEAIMNGLMYVQNEILQCPIAGGRNCYSNSPTGFPPLFNSDVTQSSLWKDNWISNSIRSKLT